MIAALLLLPFCGGLAAFCLPSDRLRPLLLPVCGLGHLILTFFVIQSGQGAPLPLAGNWIVVDPFSRLILLIVSLLFCGCSFYAVGYLRYRIAWGNRIFVSCLLLFLSAMSLAAVARHLGLLWVAVEATTVASAPLIYYNRNRLSIEATWKYLILCSVGIALAMLGILFVAYAALAGGAQVSLQFDDILLGAANYSTPWLRAGFVFLLVGFGTKAGFAPLHTWKPDAYGEAPGLVGALLAGGLTSVAFLALLRTLQIMDAAGDGAMAREAFLAMGLVSLGFAAVFVIRQPDFKRLLAYSSVEHMGILAIGVAIGGVATFGAMLHLMNNALTKGVLFLSAGNIHRRFASKRVGEVQGAITLVPVSASLFLLGFLAITGSPPFAPFISEFTILRGIFSGGHYLTGALFLFFLAVIFIGMGSTVLSVVFGTPLERKGDTNYRETLMTTGTPLVLLLIILFLGLSLPEPARKLFAEAAALLEVKP
ncbi:MAG: hydrogenase [Deltaproteobacteria bacterium]|uniref:proton-conducting transporter transmembrane domain-containing protein n=1 Tax=Hydrosulfovibrio ferrireducens TaxID=2934181 RepID=UPI001222B5FB|nr:MAG: hydrogenase [Deltaproteobacteria bacterium]